MNSQFEIAAGSVIGRDHLRSGKNNQDAYYYSIKNDYLIAFVCDGCSESIHSEIGSNLISRLLTENLLSELAKAKREPISIYEWNRLLEVIRLDTLAQIRLLARNMGHSLTETISSFFLSTAIGAIVTPQTTIIVSIGDGVFMLNDEITSIGQFPNNEPPYLCYGLVKSRVGEKNPDILKFQIKRFVHTGQVKSLLIGTDGINDLLKVTDADMPGKGVKVGPVSQFWKEDKYYKNPDMVRRKLSLINHEHVKADWNEKRLNKQRGLLLDDTTLIAMRKIRLMTNDESIKKDKKTTFIGKLFNDKGGV